MDRDRGPASVGVSALLHAGLFAVAFGMPPAVDAIDLDGLSAARPTVTLLSVPRSAPTASGSGERPGPTSGTTERVDDPGAARGARASRRRRSAAPVDAPALVAALAGALAAHTTSTTAFVAASALGSRSSVPIGGGGGGLDMIGTGRGTGAGDGDTIGAPHVSGFGLPGFGVTCGDAELERRAARYGRAVAEASCSGANAGRGMVGVGYATRVAVGVPAEPRPVVHCGGPPRGCDAEVHGTLSRDAIRRVVARHRSEIRFCYERGLEARPSLGGRVTTSWTIAPDGHVLASLNDASRTDLGAADVERCIAQAVTRWSFPASGGPTAVRYPFVLASE